MAIFYNFLIGFFGALIGVAPPGLVNMYAAKVTMKEGRKKGILFSLGVCITVMIQTYIALLFARYIEMHPGIVNVLQKVALGIFISLTIYFIFIAKDTRREIRDSDSHSKTNRFFFGMFIAVLNLLPLPYWIYIGITFSVFGWFSFSQPELWVAVLGSGLGTLGVLAVYIQFFRARDESKGFKVNMNYIIGFVTALISVLTFLKILKEF